MTINPRHDLSNERKSEVKKQLQAVQKFVLFQRGQKVPIKAHQRERMRGVFCIELPYANTHLPLLVAFPVRSQLPPEIYVQHDSFKDFFPELESIKSYGQESPLGQEFDTAFVLKELAIKASEYQVLVLKENDLVDGEVKSAIEDLHRVMPNSTQVMTEQTEVHWLVYLDHDIVGSDGSPYGTHAVLKGTTSLASLADTKITMDLYGKCGNFYKGMDTKLNLPPFDHKDEPLHYYVSKVAALLSATMKALYYAKEGSAKEDYLALSRLEV